MENVRFGIIGCGVIAAVHITALAEIAHAEFYGVFDHSPERREAFAAKYGVRAYASYAAMLADPAIDAVIICTPSGLHADQAVQALREGKHVVLEKPMALSIADCEKLCREAELSRCVLTVISQHRFREDVQTVKRLIDEGAFGKLVMCDLYMKYWRDPSYYASGAWRGTWQMDGGGALMNQGIHGVDLMRYMVGDAKLLRGRAKTLVHDIEVEDTAAALLEFDCGALGVIEASTSAYPGFSRRIEIHGSKGYATLVDSTLERLCVRGEVLVEQTVATDVGTASNPSLLGHEGHLLQLKNFVGTIFGEEELLITARDGCEAVRLIEEIYRSSERVE
jgi:predicted dehydrogenase